MLGSYGRGGVKPTHRARFALSTNCDQPTTPKGFRPKAQGCGTPLSWVTVSCRDYQFIWPNPEGVAACHRIITHCRRIRRSSTSRATPQPRWGWCHLVA